MAHDEVGQPSVPAQPKDSLNIFTNTLLQSGDLSRLGAEAIVLYLVIREFVSSQPAFPSVSQLADKTGFTFLQVESALQRLLNHHYVYLDNGEYRVRHKLVLNRQEQGVTKSLSLMWEKLRSEDWQELKQVFLSGELVDAKIIHIDHLHLNMTTTSVTPMKAEKESSEAITTPLEKPLPIFTEPLLEITPPRAEPMADEKSVLVAELDAQYQRLLNQFVDQAYEAHLQALAATEAATDTAHQAWLEHQAACPKKPAGMMLLFKQYTWEGEYCSWCETNTRLQHEYQQILAERQRLLKALSHAAGHVPDYQQAAEQKMHEIYPELCGKLEQWREKGEKDSHS